MAHYKLTIIIIVVVIIVIIFLLLLLLSSDNTKIKFSNKRSAPRISSNKPMEFILIM